MQLLEFHCWFIFLVTGLSAADKKFMVTMNRSWDCVLKSNYQPRVSESDCTHHSHSGKTFISIQFTSLQHQIQCDRNPITQDNVLLTASADAESVAILSCVYRSMYWQFFHDIEHCNTRDTYSATPWMMKLTHCKPTRCHFLFLMQKKPMGLFVCYK